MSDQSGLAVGARDQHDGAASVSQVPGGGLSAAEAAERLARYGPNELPRARPVSVWRLVAEQVRDPLVVVLLVAAVLTMATGNRF